MNTIFAAAGVIALVVSFGLVAPASAHSWYSIVCCTEQDCRPLPPDAVKATAGGWYVSPTGETIPYGDKREHQSEDSDFHGCFYPPAAAEGIRGKIRCLYVPGMGS